MMKLDPKDQRSYARPRDNSLLTMAAVALAVVACGAFGYWYIYLQYRNVYRQLGLSELPSSLVIDATVRNRLDQLSHELCYRDAIISLADILLDAGYPRETDTMLNTFSRRCGESDEVSLRRYKALLLASNFSAAALIADKLVRSNPENANIRYWRGNAYERMREFSRALEDYLAAIQLFGGPEAIDVNNYYDLSRMYAAMNRFCDAITPIETYISFDPANRRTSQLSKLISEYAHKGNCATRYANGTTLISRLPLTTESQSNTLVVVINGRPGNFILDTGATLVAVTPEFASDAKIKIESKQRLPVKTVGGTTSADLGYADIVRVGKAEAQGVPIAIVRGSSDPFGAHLDGLLGMSFLSRFKVTLSQSNIELTAIPLD